MRFTFWIILINAILFLISSCGTDNKDLLNIKEYDGPLREALDVVSFYSDSAALKLKMETPVLREFENRDKEFPVGIYLEFYDKSGAIENTIEANYCYYDFKKKEYKATGDVVVESFQPKQKLNTEELFWNEKTAKIYTDKFVIIETEEQIVKGTGLEADQDFSTYTILNSSGDIF